MKRGNLGLRRGVGTTRARLATGHEKTNAINFRIKILLSSMRQIYKTMIRIRWKMGLY